MLRSFVKFAAAAALLGSAPALAQVRTIDPDLAEAYQADPYGSGAEAAPETPATWPQETETGAEWAPVEPAAPAPAYPPAAEGSAYAPPAAAPAPGTTVPREDVFTAAEDLFGRGAEGLGGLIESILRDQGEPVAYISGQEASGAFVFGVRYGSGVMRHQIEGERAVYWTGPSIGFDFGADANKVFVLVYNLHDSQDLFKRYPGAEGNAYLVGGFTAQYLRRGDVVLIPIRLGVGLRLGVNAGYMRFSERNRWLPF